MGDEKKSGPQKKLFSGIQLGFDPKRGEDFVSLESLPPAYMKLEEKTRAAVVRNAIATLDAVVLGFGEHTDGSTFAQANFVVSRKADGKRVFIVRAATVGDSQVQLKLGADEVYQPMTRSHNLNDPAGREPWRKPGQIMIDGQAYTGDGEPAYYENIYVSMNNVWRHGLNTPSSMGRSIGDRGNKNEDKLYTATPEEKQVAILLDESPSFVRLMVNSDGTEYPQEEFTLVDIVGFDPARNDQQIVVQGGKKVPVNGSAIRDYEEKDMPPNAYIELARNPTKPEARASRDDASLFIINPDQLIEDQAYSVGVYDGHGGKVTASLCAELYPFIQAAWIIFYENFPNGNAEAFGKKLQAVLVQYCQELKPEKRNPAQLRKWLQNRLWGEEYNVSIPDWVGEITAELDPNAWKEAAQTAPPPVESSLPPSVLTPTQAIASPIVLETGKKQAGQGSVTSISKGPSPPASNPGVLGIFTRNPKRTVAVFDLFAAGAAFMALYYWQNVAAMQALTYVGVGAGVLLVLELGILAMVKLYESSCNPARLGYGAVS